MMEWSPSCPDIFIIQKLKILCIYGDSLGFPDWPWHEIQLQVTGNLAFFLSSNKKRLEIGIYGRNE